MILPINTTASSDVIPLNTTMNLNSISLAKLKNTAVCPAVFEIVEEMKKKYPV